MLGILPGIPTIPSEKGLIRPPGAPEEIQFLLECKRCGCCAQACEFGTIKIAGSEKGMAVGTPYLDLRASRCQMCRKCINACGNDVLKSARAERINIGAAEIDQAKCLAWNSKICLTCQSHCSSNAIEMDGLLRPHINDKCTGCGRCEQVCLNYPSIKVKKEAGLFW